MKFFKIFFVIFLSLCFGQDEQNTQNKQNIKSKQNIKNTQNTQHTSDFSLDSKDMQSVSALANIDLLESSFMQNAQNAIENKKTRKWN